MTIQTRFNIGDTIWFMFKNKPFTGNVKRIKCSIVGSFIEISYSPLDQLEDREMLMGFTSEDLLYTSREELLKSL